MLKGGEILKIRGLCKHPSNNNPKYTTIDATSHPHQQQQQQQQHQPTIHSTNYQPYKLIENGSVNASPLKSNKSTPRNSIDKAATSDGRSASHHHILTQNESPVVVMTSQPNQPQNYAQSMTNNINNSNCSSNNQQQQQQQHIQQSNNLIIVKKDMAIDPGDTNQIPVEHYGLISLKIAAAVKKAQQQNSISAIKKSPSNTTHSSSSCSEQRRAEFYQIDDSSLRYDAISSPPAFKVYHSASGESSSLQQIQQDDAHRYTEKKKRIAQNQKPSSSSKGNKFPTTENGQSFQLTSTTTTSATLSHEKNQQQQHNFPEALSFLTIKEEPIEWAEYDANGISAQVGDNRTEIITVKPETLEDIENSLGSEVNDKVYSPLTCEVCNLKFQIPSAWVRHIESHSELNQTQQQSIPKKRKKTDEVRKFKRAILKKFL